MVRYRLEICKGEEVRFVSHLDFMKAFERALRRGDIPVAFSEGFNPHPKISFGSALPVGVTSACELVDIELREKLPLKEFKSRMDRVLPPGIKINRVLEAEEGPALMAVLNRAEYMVKVRLKEEPQMSEEKLQKLIKEFMQQQSIVIEKRTKKGIKEVNIKPGVLALSGRLQGEWVNLKMEVETGSGMNIRAGDVLLGLEQLGLHTEKQFARVHRTRLFSDH